MNNLLVFSAIMIAMAGSNSAQSRCANERDGTLLPVPESRAGFIRCVGSAEVRETCRNGQEFNPFSRQCVTAPRASNTEPQNLCFNQPDNTKFPDPNSSTNYIVCRNNNSIIMHCNPGQTFSRERSMCVAARGQPPVRPAPNTTTRRPTPPPRPLPTRPPPNRQSFAVRGV